MLKKAYGFVEQVGKKKKQDNIMHILRFGCCVKLRFEWNHLIDNL